MMIIFTKPSQNNQLYNFIDEMQQVRKKKLGVLKSIQIQQCSV